MDDIERDREMLAKYPPHILLLVKAAKKALEEGRARIENGFLIVDPPKDPPALTPPRNGR